MQYLTMLTVPGNETLSSVDCFASSLAGGVFSHPDDYIPVCTTELGIQDECEGKLYYCGNA